MKIAILSTPSVALPPIGFAGIERVVDDLQNGLIDKGHKVVVFATGDSKVESKLEYFYKKALKPSVGLTYNPYYFLNHVYGFVDFIEKNKFDIIHLNDAGRLSLYFAKYLKTPFVTTLHGSYFPIGEKEDPYGIKEEKRKQLILFKDYPFVSISNVQRLGLKELNYIATIYNSVLVDKFGFSEKGGEKIGWLGRIAPEKGLDIAIEVAKKADEFIDIYGFIDEGQQLYFENDIKPLLNSKAKFNYEIKTIPEKTNLFTSSKLFIMPIRWNEPFGIVLLEAMACGTPVVAYARGSVMEIIKDGKTGFIVNPSKKEINGNWKIKKVGVEGLVEAVKKIYSMPKAEYQKMRQDCRKHVEENFTIKKMVSEYEKVYQKLITN